MSGIVSTKVDEKNKIDTIFLDNSLDDARLEEDKKNGAYDTVEYYYMNIYTTNTDAVFVGDSITGRVRWNEIFPNNSVKSRGIGSDTTSGVLARIDSVVQTNPKKVFLMIGINDIARGVSDEEFYKNYEEIINSLQNDTPDSNIYLQSILPVRRGKIDKEKIVGYNDFLHRLADDKGVEYIDLYTLFVDAEGLLKKELSYDGIHLSAYGYKIWKESIQDLIEN